MGDDGFISGLSDALPEMVEGVKFVSDLATNKDGLRDEILQLIKDDPTGVLAGMFNDFIITNKLMARAVGEHEEARFWDNYRAGIFLGDMATGAALAKTIKAVKLAKAFSKVDNLLEQLVQRGIKHSPEDIILIQKLRDGKIVFLEKGNQKAGFKHILNHISEFTNKGVSEAEIPDLIMRALKENNIVGYQGRGKGRPIYKTAWNGKEITLGITISDNGFIIGANVSTKFK